MKLTKTTLLTIAYTCITALVYSQQINSSNYKNTLNEAWTFSINPGLGFVVNSHSFPGTENARIATNFSGRKYFGNVGLGITGGIMAGNISKDAVNTFLSDRNYPADATVTKSNPSNSYLLFGPAIRVGEKVQFGAELSGGLFLNDAGSFTVTPQGAPRPLYSMENGNKNLFPGFSGNIHIDYPINNSTRFFISGGYLQTKSSNRILDVQQGIDIPRLQNQELKLFTAGIGIKKSFGGERIKNGPNNIDAIRIRLHRGSNLRKAGNVKGNITAATKGTGLIDAANFRALREPPTESYNPWEMDDDVEGTVLNPQYGNDGNNTSSSSSCGPVTQRTINPDGTVTETTFACPQDAAQFQQSVNSLNNSMPSRLSMTPTTAKQTQGATFGEKVNTGMQSGVNRIAGNPNTGFNNDDSTRNNILFGKVSHWASSAEAFGIATNQSKGSGRIVTKPGGMTSSSYAAGKIVNGTFNGGPGTINLRVKADGSAKSAGNTQYQLVYSDDSNSTLENADISVNPLYQSTGNTHENPLYKDNSKSISSGGGDLDRDGIPELMVSLIDPANGAVLATTKTEANGDFFFANLPTGTYAVKIEGELTQKKGYDVNIKKKMDIAGNILSTNESWAIELNTAKGTAEQAAAYVQKTRTKSNNSNDRLMGNTNDNSGLVWSPRSNFKVLPMAIADVDRDGLEEMVIGQGASLLGGALGGGFASKPGGPIKGIIVKGGRNPGGDIVVQGRTNANGEFEFENLQPGSYNFTLEQTLEIDDVTILGIGDDATNDDKSRKGWNGTVKGGSKLVNEPEEKKGRGHQEETYNPWEIDGKSGTVPNKPNVTDNKQPEGSNKVKEKATSGLKDTLKTNVLVKPDTPNSNNDVKTPKVKIKN